MSTLTESRSLPIGIVDGVDRTDSRVDVRPGSIVVLYSDVLVERRGESLDAGIRHLADVLEQVRHRPVDEIADVAIAATVDAGNATHDDVLAVVVRRAGPVDASPASNGVRFAVRRP